MITNHHITGLLMIEHIADLHRGVAAARSQSRVNAQWIRLRARAYKHRLRLAAVRGAER
jgi:hypothetical protein